MILSEIGSYLRGRGPATLSEIATRFDTPPDAIRGMLEIWVRKGRVSRRKISPSCGSGCSQCAPESTEVYQWVDMQAQEAGLRVAQLPTSCDRDR